MFAYLFVCQKYSWYNIAYSKWKPEILSIECKMFKCSLLAFGQVKNLGSLRAQTP